jgi:hypothetical protein
MKDTRDDRWEIIYLATADWPSSVNVCCADLRALVGKRGWRALFVSHLIRTTGLATCTCRSDSHQMTLELCYGCLQSPGDEGLRCRKSEGHVFAAHDGAVAVMFGRRALNLRWTETFTEG